MQPTTTIINDNLSNIVEGINIAADVVISTMGGSGKNVIINGKNEQGIEDLRFTKDGVSVAKSIKIPSAEQNIGATLLINAANKTVHQCGDGTTSTVLFIKSLVNEAFKMNIDDKNKFIEDLDSFIEQFEDHIKNVSKSIDNIDDIYKIALTSCKSATIASLIKDIYSKTGFKANISLEKSRVADRTYYDLIKGLNFESGMINSRFANQEDGTCILENATIVLEDQLVSSPEAWDKILGACMQQDVAIVIIAPMFSDVFIKHCLTNKYNGLKICLVKAPGYGNYIKENYKDILAFSTEDRVDRIVINPYTFTLFNQTNNTKISKRIKQLEKLAENAVEDYDEKDYTERIHRLNQSGAMIYVGGVTQKNIDEEYDRIEDALGAVKSALKSGYVRGAGVELIQMIPLFKDHPLYELINKVLSQPFYQILSNANITRTIKTDIPFNVKTKTYDENIIDASDIIINSLKNAISLFKLLINTSYVIHNEG